MRTIVGTPTQVLIFRIVLARPKKKRMRER
jgi:hypothetical protein